MQCILGVLDTDAGLKICEELKRWLTAEFDNVIEVHQPADGKQYEYPFIKKAVDVAVETNEPVLYLHTKGAFNTVPVIKPGRITMMNFMPKECKPEDWQKSIRKCWQNEFSGERLKVYKEKIQTKEPTVLTPFSGNGKSTWFNGFMINPEAAAILKQNLKISDNRFYYEHMFEDLPIAVIGLIYNHISSPQDDSGFDVYKKIWSFSNS